MTDPVTGAFILQLTTAQNASAKLYFELQSFLCDDKTIVFHSQRTPGRGAPMELFRVDVDGANLAQLTDESHPLDHPVPSWKERAVYGLRGNVLIRLNVDTFEETEIARCEEATSFVSSSLSGDDTYFFTIASMKDGKKAVVRFATDGSDVTLMCHGIPVNHINANPAGTQFTFNRSLDTNDPGRIQICDFDGGKLRAFPFQHFAHRSWLGRTGRMQGPLAAPGRGIGCISPDETELRLIAGGSSFWHSGSSLDGKWIVSDTNWPDVGIQLVHVESGRYACLAKSLGTNSVGQETHPHPSFNRAGTHVLFNSDRTGVPQIYLATIPDTIRDEVENGTLTHRQRWPGHVI
jgi:hypothetical protein